MKKKIFILGICILLVSGCGKIPTLANGEEAVVKFKDGGISANQFYNEIKDKYGLQTLISLIDKYVLELEFPEEIENKEKEAEAQIKALKANYESDDDLLSALQNYGYGSIDAYKDSVYINSLQNYAIESYAQSKVTDEELENYYEENIYPNMTISHILITSSAKSDATDEEKEKAEEEAKEKAEKIIKELKNTKDDIATKFKELAKKNSEDDATKNKGGNLGEINIGDLDSQYDELIKAAAKLKDGEYSKEVIETSAGYHVILKTKTGEKKEYDDVVEEMTEEIAKNNLNNKLTLITDAIQYYRKKYDMDIIDSEMDSQYSKYMNNLINSYANRN